MTRLTDDRLEFLARLYVADVEMSALISELRERRQDDRNLVNRRQQNVRWRGGRRS
jgi:hypothetical protein